ncbi:MAG: type I 3-dehydroquinate dehydratase [Deltaproteobacteria bacterium]|nr:type I 3-dehydroquinate dehydratase [Deltaproteobacteria bacterium]
MIKIGRLNLGSRPLIAAVITDNRNRQVFKKAVKEGADLLELRIDFFKNTEGISETIKWSRENCKVPIIGTVRSRIEGSKKLLTDRERREIFQNIIPFVDAVDIELSSKEIIEDVVNTAKGYNKKIIISYHNFKETPSDDKLDEIVKQSKKRGADIIKLAVMSMCYNDILRLANLTLKHKNIITISMGKMAKISRVLFPIFGSLITYGETGTISAPGQIPLKILKRELELYSKRGGF